MNPTQKQFSLNRAASRKHIPISSAISSLLWLTCLLPVATIASGNDLLIAGANGVIHRLDPSTGKVMVLSSGGLLNDIDDITIGPDGFIYAGNGGPPRTVRIDPKTGQQTLLSSEAIGWNLVVEKDGNIITANSTTVRRLNPVTGASAVVSSGGLLDDIDDIAIGPDGSIYAGNGGPPRTVRIDPKTGQQTLLSSEAIGWNLVVENDGNIITANYSTVRRLNPVTGTAVVVSSGGLLDDTDDIAIGPDGFIYAGNGGPPRTVRIDPKSGQQTLLCSEPIGWNLAVLPASAGVLPHPQLYIYVRKVDIVADVVVGRTYQLNSSTDLITWTAAASPFTANAQLITNSFDVNVTGRYFRIIELP